MSWDNQFFFALKLILIFESWFLRSVCIDACPSKNSCVKPSCNFEFLYLFSISQRSLFITLRLPHLSSVPFLSLQSQPLQSYPQHILFKQYPYTVKPISAKIQHWKISLRSFYGSPDKSRGKLFDSTENLYLSSIKQKWISPQKVTKHQYN